MKSPAYLHHRFNAAAWSDQQTGNTVLLARHLEKKGDDGEPDKGKLVRLIVNDQKELVREDVVWQPTNDDLHLEDPRALRLPDHRILIGLTAVMKRDNDYIPYPAIGTISSNNEDTALSQITIIENFGSGKNATPFDEQTLVFRPDHATHTLTVLHWDGVAAQKMGEIDFSEDIPAWAEYKMGTTMSPIWINENEALLLIHGIRFVDDIYHYAIGRAKIQRENSGYKVIDVDDHPLISPQDFSEDELHDFRRVVYSCGGLLKTINGQEMLNLYVNVGDLQTVQVDFPLHTLKEGFWISEQPVSC